MYKYLFYILLLSSIGYFFYQETTHKIEREHNKPKTIRFSTGTTKGLNYFKETGYFFCYGIWQSKNEKDKPFLNKVHISCDKDSNKCESDEIDVNENFYYITINDHNWRYDIKKWDDLELIAVIDLSETPCLKTGILHVDFIYESVNLTYKYKKNSSPLCPNSLEDTYFLTSAVEE